MLGSKLPTVPKVYTLFSNYLIVGIVEAERDSTDEALHSPPGVGGT